MTAEVRVDRTAELQRQLEAGVAGLVEGEEWARMLEVAARFHSYSFGNVMLIVSQRPDASRVAGYRAWQALGRQVRKGEKGISILAPCTVRRSEVDDQGEEVERRHVFFKVAHVFDVAQTDGDELADVAPVLLDGEAPAGLWAGLASMVEARGFSLERGDCGGANGLTSWADRVVRVRGDVSEAQACKTLAHELGHVLLHDGSMVCRGVKEVEAESVAYIVSAASGLPTESYSLAYVARWAGGDLGVIKSTGQRVLAASNEILAGLEVDARELVSA